MGSNFSSCSISFRLLKKANLLINVLQLLFHLLILLYSFLIRKLRFFNLLGQSLNDLLILQVQQALPDATLGGRYLATDSPRTHRTVRLYTSVNL